MAERARNDWIDPWGETTLPWVEEKCRNAGCNSFALLDMAFAPSLQKPLAKLTAHGEQRALFAGKYQGKGLDDLSPILLRMPDTTEARANVLAILKRHCDGKPMFSLILSEQSLSWLTAHLQAQMEAVNSHGEAFLLRLADTRAMAALFGVFSDEQRMRLLGGIRQWCFLDRNGEPRIHEGSALPDSDPDTLPYLIEDQQRETLNRLALPDALLFQIRSRSRAFGTLTGRPSLVHACVEKALQESQDRQADHDAVMYRNVVQHLQKSGLLTSPSLAEAS